MKTESTIKHCRDLLVTMWSAFKAKEAYQGQVLYLGSGGGGLVS